MNKFEGIFYKISAVFLAPTLLILTLVAIYMLDDPETVTWTDFIFPSAVALFFIFDLYQLFQRSSFITTVTKQGGEIFKFAGIYNLSINAWFVIVAIIVLLGINFYTQNLGMIIGSVLLVVYFLFKMLVNPKSSIIGITQEIIYLNVFRRKKILNNEVNSINISDEGSINFVIDETHSLEFPIYKSKEQQDKKELDALMFNLYKLAKEHNFEIDFKNEDDL